MNRAKSSALPSLNQADIEFTKKSMTAFGGVATILALFLEKIGFREWVERGIPIVETSPNSKGIYGKVLALFLTILAGGRRFAHFIACGSGVEVNKAAFGVEWLPGSSSVITRFFNKVFDQKIAEAFGDAVRTFARQVVEWMGKTEGNLNFDSSVVTRYGEQEGAKKGYNPQKPGRPSHHPLIAFLGAGFVVNIWNRPGNTHASNGIIDFFCQTFDNLAENFTLKRVLCDSGFYQIEFISFLEAFCFKYIIAVRMDRRLQRYIFSLKAWKPVTDGIDVCEFYYQPMAEGWNRPRCYVAVRQSKKVRQKATGKQLSLFEELDPKHEYRYGLFATNDESLSAVEVWREYRPRASDENVIKTLKHDWGIDAYCLQSFWATEAVMSMIALVFYNIIHYLNITTIAPNGPEPRLGTLRRTLLILPAILGTSGRRAVIRIAVSERKIRSRLTYLLHQIARISEQLKCIAIEVKERPKTPICTPATA